MILANKTKQKRQLNQGLNEDVLFILKGYSIKV